MAYDIKLNRPSKLEQSKKNSFMNGKTIPYLGFEPETNGSVTLRNMRYEQKTKLAKNMLVIPTQRIFHNFHKIPLLHFQYWQQEIMYIYYFALKNHKHLINSEIAKKYRTPVILTFPFSHLHFIFESSVFCFSFQHGLIVDPAE
jgi:hypothetical protein